MSLAGKIIAFRDYLNHQLTLSLQNNLLPELDNIYKVAMQVVVKKTGLSADILLVSICYSFSQILDENWYLLS